MTHTHASCQVRARDFVWLAMPNAEAVHGILALVIQEDNMAPQGRTLAARLIATPAAFSVRPCLVLTHGIARGRRD